MKTRFAILAALALATPPAWGQSRLITACNIGRQYNSAGTSYWNPRALEKRALADGIGLAFLVPYKAGEEAEMSKACPDVW